MPTSLDPQMQAVIDDVRTLGIPDWHTMSVACCRRVEDEIFSEGSASPPVEQVRELSIDVPVGEIPIRVYWPDGGDDRPMLVYFHGGGWVVGTLDGVDDICRTLAVDGGCIVVSVAYSLAPEHQFPTQVEEAHAVTQWVAANAEALRGDPDRLAVAGTSAGGNLATVTTMLARERGGPPIEHQLLLYPVTNHAFDTDSYIENSEGYLLSRASMRWFWDTYLRSDVDGHNPFASPLRADDLAGLPPATVVTAGFDPLRDEGIAYADRLAEAGVSVEHHHFERMCHGFLSMTDDVDAATDALDEVAECLREAMR